MVNAGRNDDAVRTPPQAHRVSIDISSWGDERAYHRLLRDDGEYRFVGRWRHCHGGRLPV